MAAKKSATTTARTQARADVAKDGVETVAVAVASDTKIEAEAIEDVVGVSPVIEALKETVSDKALSLSEIETVITKTQAEVTTHMEKAMKSAEEFVSFGQGNLEAMMKASQVLATGLQDLSKHIAATAQASLDETTAHFKALSAVKSPKEALDLQTAAAKTAIEKTLAEAGKVTDASMKLAEQVAAPITARVTLAVEKFGKAA